MKGVTCTSSAELELGNIVPGVFTPVLRKHTKSFNLVDTLSVGVDRIQRNFEPMQRQVELWRKTQLTDERAKLIFLQRVHRQCPRRSKESSAGSPLAVLRAGTSGVLGAYHVEPVQRVHQRVQDSRSHSTVRGHSQAGWLSRTAAGIVKVEPFRLANTLDGVRLVPVRRTELVKRFG